MKKLIKYFLIVVIVVIAIPSKQTGLEDLIDKLNLNNVKNIYYTTYSAEIENATLTQCGSAVFVESDVEHCKQVKSELHSINGQSLSFEGDSELYNQLIAYLFHNVVLTENVSNVKCCYGYNNKLNNFITIDGKTINIQIALNNNKITIGTPVILGSY